MEPLTEILGELLPYADLEKEKSLVDDHILESMDIMTLIPELEDAYDIRIPRKEICAKNLNSVEAMLAMIERLKEE